MRLAADLVIILFILFDSRPRGGYLIYRSFPAEHTLAKNQTGRLEEKRLNLPILSAAV